MKTSRKLTSIDKEIRKLILKVFGISLIGLVLGILVYKNSEYQKNINRVQNELISGADYQVQRIIPSLMIDEQKESLSMILYSIKDKEQLSDISYMKSHNLNNCNVLANNGVLSCIDDDLNVVEMIIPIKVGRESLGYLSKVKLITSPEIVNQSSIPIFISVIIFFLASLMLCFWVIKIFKTKLKDPIDSFKEMLPTVFESDQKITFNVETDLEEIFDLVNSVEKMSNFYISQKSKHMLWEVASQVAHDIRSPLVALKMTSKRVEKESIPDDIKHILKGSINRINDIANNLISVYKNENDIYDKVKSCMLRPLVESIVSEKRASWCNSENINLHATYDLNETLFVEVNPSHFKRILSNLINNSYEALVNEVGEIEIIISSKSDNISISIKDNGVGIKDNFLKDLGAKGFSNGKNGGLGLGLYHAKKMISHWGGKVEVESELGVGTNVNISLPLQASPSWLAKDIVLLDYSNVVVVDDDPSIHDMWADKLQNILKHNQSILNFKDPHEFRDFVKSRNLEKSSCLFLIDYEFSNFNLNGIKLIEELGLQRSSVLVTSRYDSEALIHDCENVSISLVPKDQLEFIQVTN